MAVGALEFFNLLTKEGVDFFTGVPDSLLKDFCSCISEKVPRERNIIAANEGNAVALASGYYLATGKLPLVYMQNSGFGNALNPLLSLCDPEIYAIPLLILMGWRGEPGTPDAVQHRKDGRVQVDLLSTLNILYDIFSPEDVDIDKKAQRAIDAALKESRPFVLLIRKGTFTEYKPLRPQSRTGHITREEALDLIMKHFDNRGIFVTTTGRISREVFELRERNRQSHERDFLTVGAMGHCSSIALGNALARPQREVICIDGDGALIMHMGAMAIIGSQGPPHFRHIVINNGAHESVGGQPTVGFQIDICAMAKACGYKQALRAETTQELKQRLELLQKSAGPGLLEVRVSLASRKDLGRPSTNLIEDRHAFMKALINA